MANLRILEKELIPERQVVLEERRMRVDNVARPSCSTRRCASSCSAGTSPTPCRRRAMSTTSRSSASAISTAFYRRFYAPNNAVLIVAGDTTAEQVRKLAEKYYGPIPSRQVEPRQPSGRGRRRPAAARDPRRRAGRRAALDRGISWRRPIASGETRHAYALLVLARLFGGSETSRLSRALVASARSPCRRASGYSADGPRPHHVRDCRPSRARPQRGGGRERRSATR